MVPKPNENLSGKNEAAKSNLIQRILERQNRCANCDGKMYTDACEDWCACMCM